MSDKKKAVEDGRAFIRVKAKGTGRLTTAGVCPACWNLPARRPSLLSSLSRLGYAPARVEDEASGVYIEGSTHAPGCPYGGTKGGI